jgi:exodeoxyribonuclease V alpha subunit
MNRTLPATGKSPVEAVSVQLLRDCSVLSDEDPPELRAVYEAAVAKLDLQLIDYLTIRDLVALAGSGGEPLHLLLIAMFMSLYEGSVCLRLSEESLGKKLAPLAGDGARSPIRAILKDMGDFSELIYEKDPSGPRLFDDPRDSYRPLVLVREGGDRFLYFQKYYSAEQALKATLADILSRKTTVPESTAPLAAAVKAVLAERPLLLGGAPAVLNPGQLLGMVLPSLNNFVLVSGGPGTGKTFIVINLLRTMARLGVRPERMRITAPTGRAAQKLAEAVRRGILSLADPDEADLALASVQGETLHRLLRYSPSRNDFMHDRYNRLPADLIVIDEASMIDIMLLGRLLESAEEGARIVMLGDRNQLPSVEAGAVLSDLIAGSHTARFSDAAAAVVRDIVPGLEAAQLPAAPANPLEDRVVILTDSYRSEQGITAIAVRINAQDESVAGEIPLLDPRDGLPGHGVWRVEPGAAGGEYRRGLHALLAAWAERYYESAAPSGASYRDIVAGAGASLAAGGEDSTPLRELFVRIDEARILSPLRSGAAGTTGINRYLADGIGRTIDPGGTGQLFAGAPVIVTRNDYNRSLFNGDVGVIMRTGGRYSGLFSRYDGFVSFPVEALSPLELSFAITVHKSQGSEYGAVLLVLPEGMTDLLLTKEILYTGLTRAKHLVIIYAGRDMLRRAIHNRLERESGIRF